MGILPQWGLGSDSVDFDHPPSDGTALIEIACCEVFTDDSSGRIHPIEQRI
jgi:hypothetical protein